MAIGRALMLWTAFAVGAAYAEVRTLPVKASLKGEVLTGELEVIDGTFLTLVVGSERHPLSVWDRTKTEKIVSALDALAQKAPDARVIAAPYELTDAYKNAAVQNVFLTLSHPRTMSNLQIDKVQLDVTFAHRPLDQAELQRAKASVELETARPAFAYDRPESYAIAFGDNVIPVRIVEKIEQTSPDRHGNPKKEWRARIVPLDEWWSREEKPRLYVMDVPVASLLFLDQDTTDLNVERIRKQGLTIEESMGVGMYGLGSLTIDPKEDAAAQVKAFTADKRADTNSTQNILLKAQKMRELETARARDEDRDRKERSQEIRLLLEEYPDIDPEQREAVRKDIEALSPAPESVHEKMIAMLELYDGPEKKLLRESIVKLFNESHPLPITTVMLLGNKSLSPDPEVRKSIEAILVEANAEKSLEKNLTQMLLSPATSVDQVAAVRKALVMCKPSAEVPHQLLIALGASDQRLRDVAKNTLAELGPFPSDFHLEIVKLLSSEFGRESAADLLLKLNPSDEATKDELVKLVKVGQEPVKTTAGELLGKLSLAWGWIEDEEVAAFVTRCRNQHH